MILVKSLMMNKGSFFTYSNGESSSSWRGKGYKVNKRTHMEFLKREKEKQKDVSTFLLSMIQVPVVFTKSSLFICPLDLQ